ISSCFTSTRAPITYIFTLSLHDALPICYHVWSETYDRKLDDIFQVQDEIASAVVKALKVSLLEGEMPKAMRTANQEAYALYLQGRSLHYRGTHADAQKAITYMEQALKLDPMYAPAWFGL